MLWVLCKCTSFCFWRLIVPYQKFGLSAVLPDTRLAKPNKWQLSQPNKKICHAYQLVAIFSRVLICRTLSLLWQAVPWQSIHLFFHPSGNNICHFVTLLPCIVLSSSSRPYVRNDFMTCLTNLGQESGRTVLVIQRVWIIVLLSYIQL